MFNEEEMADNVTETSSEQDVAEKPTSPVDQTKAFAARLKEEKAKARDEVREEIAHSFGYNSWTEYNEAQTNSKLLDKGLDPESVRPVLKDLLKEDPDYIEAMKFKAEKEELEKQLFAKTSLEDLNSTYGTNYKSVNELDADTVDMWNKGTPLKKAFAANHVSELLEAASKKASVRKETGKEHLSGPLGAGNAKSTAKEISAESINVAKMFGFSEEEFKNYVNRTNK